MRYQERPLGKRLRIAGYTLKSLASEIGIAVPDLSNFVRGRLSRVGRGKKILIRSSLVRMGLLSPPSRHKPPRCRICGTEYPTRKERQI
jgi:hypothetical protein